MDAHRVLCLEFRICGAPLKNYSCSSQAATSFDFVAVVAECDLTPENQRGKNHHLRVVKEGVVETYFVALLVFCRNMFFLYFGKTQFTLPETNIAPKNGGFQQESPFPGLYFQVLC